MYRKGQKQTQQTSEEGKFCHKLPSGLRTGSGLEEDVGKAEA